MPAQGGLVVGGPADYWSDQLPPSRGQYRDLALLALRVLGIEEPQSRLEATTAQVRLRAAIEQMSPQGGGPGAVVNFDPRLDIEAARCLIRMPAERAQDIVEAEAVSLAERRVARQRKGRNGTTPRCGACNAFLRSISHPCTKCGYLAGRGFAA